MQILLTHGYFLDEDAKERAIMKPYAPLGILYLSSHLRARGLDVDVYDATFGSRAELLGLFAARRPGLVGIYGNLLTRRAVVELGQAARAAGHRVVLGGPEPANYAREYLDAGADVIVRGEGETVLEELAEALPHGPAALARVRGILFRDPGGAVVETEARPLLPDLDAQPWPDRERIALERYLETWRRHHGVGSVSVITARGCPYRCRWCSHGTYGYTHRRRSPRGVADEVEWLVGRYAPDMLWMADDVFTIHHGWVRAYAAELARRGLRVPFECITRADRLDERIADALAELGCFRVWIGSESGSQRILDAMERGVTVDEVQRAVRACRERGIQTGMFLMWGYEGEELADVEATVEHVKATLPDVFLTTVAYPIRGTEYHRDVRDRLVEPGDWLSSTDRQLEPRGRRPRSWFDLADRLLRAEVARERLRRQAPPDAPEPGEVRALRAESAAARAGLDRLARGAA